MVQLCRSSVCFFLLTLVSSAGLMNLAACRNNNNSDISQLTPVSVLDPLLDSHCTFTRTRCRATCVFTFPVLGS